MARKNKIGLDYFSHDVEMFSDIKIKFIKAKHGLIGYAVFLRLLENIYKENGYYIQIDDKFNILFADDNKLDINVYINVLNDCINENLFNKEIYEKHGILTSKRIQLNFLAGAERRKNIEFDKRFLMLSSEFLVNDNIKIIDVNINSENEDISTQKEIESKEKEKEKENIPYKEIIDCLNSKAGTNYKYTTNKTKELIKDRFNENFSLKDFETVINKKCYEWLETDMNKFLRPETLFGTKFESYLNQTLKNYQEQTPVIINRVHYDLDSEGNEIKF